MAEKILTGFHAIEERMLHAADMPNGIGGLRIYYGTPGPRVKKIIARAQSLGVKCAQIGGKDLDALVRPLPEPLRDHRGIVMTISGEAAKQTNLIAFDEWISEQAENEKKTTVLVLDSVTDPHNVGAILRSCDQFGVAAVIIPETRSAKDVTRNDVVARASAGASAWVPVAVVSNLVRAVEQLKTAGFWVYGADADGEPLPNIDFAKKTVIVMGSEGSGMAKLLADNCDMMVSIPTCGKIDSLNVSVAAGVLLYARNCR